MIMKNKENSIRKLVVCLLLCSMLTAAFVSCGGEETPAETAGSGTEETAVQKTETEAPPNITDQKFSGEDFNIAYMTGGSYGMGNEVDYTFEESQASAITASVYERNSLTEEYLDININGTFIDPAGGNFNNTIVNLVQAGDAQYDAICNYLRYNYQLVQQQALLNLREIDSLCLDNAWWDQSINELFSFGGTRQFFATGDICFDDDCTTPIMLFSKRLHEDNGIAEPYENIQNGTWTLDTMSQNMTSAYQDLNGDGVMDKNDSYGFGTGVGGYLELMVSCDALTTAIDDKGYPQFAYTYNSEKMVNAFDTIFNKLIINPAVLVTEYDLASDYTGIRNMFANNQFMYFAQAIGSLQSLRDQMDDGFGAILYPKLDEKQEQYYSYGSMWASTYALPATSENPEQTGAILNTMGYYSIDTMKETVIQNVVLSRNLRDEQSEEMVRIAIDNKIYDVGYALGLADCHTVVYNIVSKETMTFVSDMEALQPKFETAVAALIDAYGGVQ